MQNEFEKQVQQKMEELNFTPSEPVWLNIEKQIRNKKDKRRLFIWLPLVIAFLSGSLFIVYNSQKRSTSVSKVYAKVKSNESVVTYNNSNHIKNNKENNVEWNKETVDSKKIGGNNIPGNNIIEKPIPSYKMNNAIAGRNWYQKQQRFNVISTKNGIKQEAAVGTKTNDFLRQIDIESNNQHERQTLPLIYFERINASPFTNFHREDIVKGNLIANMDKTIPGLNKWKLYLKLSPGYSKIIDHTGYTNTAIAYSNPGTYPTSGSQTAPGSFQNSFSFQIGVGLQKRINERFLIATGIDYSYYSSKSTVGSIVKQDTVIKSYAVSQYYLNSTPPNNNVSAGTSAYLNKLQFIGIPVTLHYSVFKKLPFSIYGGIKIEDLIASDLLIYDPSLDVYYSSKEAMNHIQFFSVGGMEYTIQLRKLTIKVGPELTYGIGNIVKGYNNHLRNVAATVKISFPEGKN